MNSHPYVCVPCREAKKDMINCNRCGQPAEHMSYRWRAPKRSNEKAWKLIESGDWLWDKSVVREQIKIAPDRQKKPKSHLHDMLKEIYRKRYLTHRW